ncbi:MAG: Ig-like domain-containing protein, partial [Lachnospiraceae bacterium]|nr:Ig-like domain-containing protein [Lachnospiraceae bacterium]
HGVSYNLGGKVITIACPTDVYMYDESGSLVVSIENNIVTQCSGMISASSINDVKIITVPLNQNYIIKVDATNNGSMSYSISEYDASYQNIRTISYKDISIIHGTSYNGLINNELETNPDSYNLISSDSEIISNYDNIAKELKVPVSSLKIDTMKDSLSVGESVVLSKVILPENASVNSVVWTSSNSEIATVSEKGIVTAIAEGTAIITASSLYGGIQDSIAFTITSYKDMIYITEQPKNGKYMKGDRAEPISVKSSIQDDNDIMYQWYVSSNSDMSEKVVIDGATTFKYIPSTQEVGILYYCVELTYGNERIVSNIIEIEVIEKSAVYSGTCGDNIQWVLTEDNQLCLYGFGSMKKYVAEENVPWHEHISIISSVRISEGITNITEYAFANLINLQTVYFEGNAPEIGENSFRGCKNIVAYIPITDITWTEEIKKSYGADNIEWKMDVQVSDKEYGDVISDDVPEDGIIPDGLWAAGIIDTTYTGSAITQSFRLYDSTKRLKEKTDYTVSYKNNKVAYTYTDEDYTSFEKTLADTGKRTKTGTFDPARAPQVIIKMKGNYAGTRIIYFRILAADITGDAFSTDDLTATFAGKKQTPAPVLTWNGKSLKYGTDFYIPEYDSAKSNKDAFTQSGTYDLTITGKKNFTGKIPVTFTISESSKQIAMHKVSVKGIKSQLWTGTSIEPSGFIVSYKKDVLSETNGDYMVSFGENTAVGIGTVILTGTGTDGDGDGYSYIGTKTVSFKITGTAMNKVTVGGIAKNYTYTGESIEPDAVLTYQANKNASPVTLTEGIHYTVDYQKNTDKGTATVIFTGLADGGYTGTKKQTFKIVSSGIEDRKEGTATVENISVSFKDASNVQNGVYIAPYMKGGATPQVTVTSGSRTLVSGKDYTVSYLNNKKPALSTDVKSPTVVVKGKGNYTGSKQVPFSIAAKALTNENGIKVVAADKTVSTKKNGYRQNFKIYDSDGKALSTGDYEKGTATYTLIQTENADGTFTDKNELLDKDSIVPAGSVIQITVQGKGIYAGGSASGTYRILNSGYDISKATIQISNQPYTGNPVRITEQEQFKESKVYVKIGKEKRALILGQDIEVVPDSYVRNINKGTAKVTFRGINGFGGTKTVSYKIGVRSVADFWKGIFNRITKGS